ncbi:MAG: PqqD family protein [Butyribacter sp.]|nr:PqqD family protein [bacterium]MDY3854406.1 PqqD family protein [Butyribacter sp.]
MIKRNPNYLLYKTANAYYLLPYGQPVADHKRGIRINPSGAVLWELLEEKKQRQELFEDFCVYYEAEDDKRQEMKKDMDGFLALLLSQGILIEEEEKAVLSGAISRYFKIGIVCIKMTAPKEAFPEEFSPYETEACQADLTIDLKVDMLRTQETGNLLIRNQEIMIFERQEEYLFQFLQSQQLEEGYLSKDGKYASLWYMPPCTETLREEVFHAIRFFYLYTAQLRGCFALHSASVLYDGKAWLFSGYSGAGKSTHVNLWKKLFDTPVLNGDLNLIGFSEGEAVIYGIPWCGTSGISQSARHLLGGIVFLKQAVHNKCVTLATDRKVIMTAQRLISPMWTKELYQKNLAFAEALQEKIAICRLECTKEDEAAQVMQEWIQENEKNRQ